MRVKYDTSVIRRIMPIPTPIQHTVITTFLFWPKPAVTTALQRTAISPMQSNSVEIVIGWPGCVLADFAASIGTYKPRASAASPRHRHTKATLLRCFSDSPLVLPMFLLPRYWKTPVFELLLEDSMLTNKDEAVTGLCCAAELSIV
jgi:hypothetical protein